MATAIASVTAGFSVAVLAAVLAYNPPSTATHGLTARAPVAHQFMSGLVPETASLIPPPVGLVEIGPITYTLLNPPRRIAAREPCQSGWRVLDHGPLGRQVYASCPGDTRPVPASPTQTRSSLERLPKVTQVHATLPRLSDPSEQAQRATEGARSLKKDLSER